MKAFIYRTFRKTFLKIAEWARAQEAKFQPVSIYGPVKGYGVKEYADQLPESEKKEFTGVKIPDDDRSLPVATGEFPYVSTEQLKAAGVPFTPLPRKKPHADLTTAIAVVRGVLKRSTGMPYVEPSFKLAPAPEVVPSSDPNAVTVVPTGNPTFPMTMTADIAKDIAARIPKAILPPPPIRTPEGPASGKIREFDPATDSIDYYGRVVVTQAEALNEKGAVIAEKILNPVSVSVPIGEIEDWKELPADPTPVPRLKVMSAAKIEALKRKMPHYHVKGEARGPLTMLPAASSKLLPRDVSPAFQRNFQKVWEDPEGSKSENLEPATPLDKMY